MAQIARNPYVAGNPVGDGPAYVGREDVLRAVLRVLRHEHQNAIVLYGQRRIGKTSILQYLHAHLPEEGPYRPVYLDLQDKAALPLGRVLEDLAEAIAQALGLPPPQTSPDPETAFRDLWLPAVLAALPTDSALVLLMDEFDVLADPKTHQAANAFFPYLRGLLASDPERLKFEFVIGRNVGDLDNIALSVFKGTPAHRVSLLSREECERLVRLAQDNGTLAWSQAALDRVWELTSGHPFLTQQLCLHVWERAYDEAPAAAPAVDADGVDGAVDEALEASRNTMEWLWDGLPPAERVVASTLAQAGASAITAEALERLLYDSGVRVVIRELQSAPHLLQEWDLIEPAAGGYRFRVELLRRWIATNKPLRRVQEELDHVEPVAENLYQAALGLYRSGQLDQAAGLLRQSLALNPNHVRANQLLADLLLAESRPGEAADLLEQLHKYQPAAARPRLIQALLTQAQQAAEEQAQLSLYARIRELDPAQPEAAAGWEAIWRARGDAEMQAGNPRAALECYQSGGLDGKAAEAAAEIRRAYLVLNLKDVEEAERSGAYAQALEQVRELAASYPEDRDWTGELERLEAKLQMDELYTQGVGALHSGDRQTAQALLARVIALDPTYAEAARYLYQAVSGADPAQTRPRAGRRAGGQAQAGRRAGPQAWPMEQPSAVKERPGPGRRPSGEGRTIAGALAGLALVALVVVVVLTTSALRLGRVRSLAFSPDGSMLAVGALDKRLLLVDARTGKLLHEYDTHFAVASLAFSPDGEIIAQASPASPDVVLSKARSGTIVHYLDHPTGVLSVAFSPDGSWLATVPEGTRILLWAPDSGVQQRALSGHLAQVISVAFSPDGKTLASGSVNGSVSLWDVERGRRLRVLGTHGAPVTSVAFGPDGTMMAAGSEDGGVSLWQPETGARLHTLRGDGDGVSSLAFSPDGRILAEGSLSHKITLWNLSTRARLRTLEGHSDRVWVVAFSPDGKTLASGSEDTTVILWDVETGKQLRTIR